MIDPVRSNDPSRQGEGGPRSKSPSEKTADTLSILQIALGATGLLMQIQALVRAPMGRDPVTLRLHELLNTGEVGSYMHGSLVVGGILSCFLIGVGWAMRTRKSFAVALTWVHAMLALAFGLASIWIVFGILMPALSAFADQNGVVGQAGLIGGVAGGIVGGVFALAFPFVEMFLVRKISFAPR